MSKHNKITATRIRAGSYDLDGFRRYRVEKTGKYWELFRNYQGKLVMHHGIFPTLDAAKAEAERVDEEAGSDVVVRENFMSGEPFEERADTPCYLSPACESYWSM